jgi:hypothetical protein
MSLYGLKPSDLSYMDQFTSVDFFRRLLWAEASRVGIARCLLDVPDCINVGDGGLDAVIYNATPSIDDVIPIGFSGFQIKSTDLSPEKCKKEIHKQNKLNAPPKPEVEKLLKSGGTYVLVLFKEITAPMKRRRQNALIEEFSALGFKNPKVRIYSANQLAGFAERHLSVIICLKDYLGIGISYKKWSENTDIKSPGKFVPDIARSKIMSEIRTNIRNSTVATVHRITGLSGLGKTRLVFETLVPYDLSNRVTYLRAELFKNSSLLQHFINDADLHAIIVVDECSIADHEYFSRLLSGRGPRIALVTISNEVGAVPAPTLQFRIEKLPDNEIKTLISQEMPALPPIIMERLVSFADGYPRIAILLSEKYVNLQPKEDLLSISDSHLLNNLISESAGISSDHFLKTKRVLMGLSLFEKVGYKGECSEESEWVANFVNVNWVEFQEIVRAQKDRGIIQGEYYIYVTPFILAVYLLREWWDTHGERKSFDQIINEIPEKLRKDMMERFTSRFSYLDSVESGRNLVKMLLSESGIYSDGSLLKEKAGAAMFLSLTEANPELALNCLKRTMGSWTKAQLKLFISGRREIIYALQKIAVWKDYFGDAARLLLALGEAENESYANNASGVFTDLFTPASGEVAPTEASPKDRFPILVEALNSDSYQRRKLGLSATQKALQFGHFFRAVGPEYQGGHAPPKLWTPKTYGEIFGYYRLVWEYIDHLLERFDGQTRNEAAGILLNSARAVASTNNLALSEMIIATMKRLNACEWVDKKKLIETVSLIAHYDEKRMPAEIAEKWIALRDELVGTSFKEMLLRYVGLHLVQDFFHGTEKYDTQWVNSKILELAEDAIKDPNLLENEYRWLTSREAQRGYQFGYELGKLDIEFALLDRLVLEQGKAGVNGDVSFLGGYFRALFERNVNRWEDELNKMSVSSLKMLVPELTWRSGISDKAINRLIDMIRTKEIPVSSLGIFTFGGVAKKISQSTFFEFVTFMMSQKEALGAIIALELVQFRYHDSDAMLNKDLTLQLLLHSSFWTPGKEKLNDMAVYGWRKIAALVISQFPESEEPIANRIIDFFGEEGTVAGGFHSEVQDLLANVVKKNPDRYWNLLSKHLEGQVTLRAFRLSQWLRGEIGFSNVQQGIIEYFRPEIIWKWVDEDKEDRSVFLATFVPPRFFLSSEKECLARELLVRYGENVDVRNNLIGNFYNDSWTGPSSAHYLGKKNQLLEYAKKESNPRVILWINEYVELLDTNIERAKASEEKQGY